LRLRDWPGFAGPLVHVPSPFSDSGLVEAIADRLAPRYRVLSLLPRLGIPYQVSTSDLLATLDQFGFIAPILIGERLGCLPALLIGAWYARAGGVILVDPMSEPTGGESIEARALRDCPPAWPALQDALRCPSRMLRSQDERVVDGVEAFLASLP
jgi:hypothetical protein